VAAAEAYLLVSNFAGAVERLTRALDLFPSEQYLYLKRYHHLVYVSTPFSLCLVLVSTKAAAHSLRSGNAQRQAGRYQLALEDFQKALELAAEQGSAGTAEAQRLIAQTYNDIGKAMARCAGCWLVCCDSDLSLCSVVRLVSTSCDLPDPGWRQC
jgi:tetratricopeptide (TPR) repeat protein